jgi:hypothetical protein
MNNLSGKIDVDRWISLLEEKESFSDSLIFIKQLLRQGFLFSLNSFETICSILKTKNDQIIDGFELISLFYEKFSFILPSGLMDEILATLFSNSNQSLEKLIQPFMKIVSLLSEQQVQNAIQILSHITIINDELISLFWKLGKQIQNELSLLPIWKMVSTDTSFLISKFLCQFYLQNNLVEIFLNRCLTNLKSI